MVVSLAQPEAKEMARRQMSLAAGPSYAKRCWLSFGDCKLPGPELKSPTISRFLALAPKVHKESPTWYQT